MIANSVYDWNHHHFYALVHNGRHFGEPSEDKLSNGASVFSKKYGPTSVVNLVKVNQDKYLSYAVIRHTLSF